jgi:biotin carboxylase
MSHTQAKPIVIVLGGVTSHISLIESLKDKGWETILVDYLDNPPARAHADRYIQHSCLDTDKVFSIASEFGAKCIATSHIDKTIPVAAMASERLGIPFYLTSEQAVALTDKSVMKRILTDAGVQTSSYIIIDEEGTYKAESMSYPFVCKPVDNWGSLGLSIIHNQGDAQRHLKNAFQVSESKRVVLEEFTNGPEYSVDICVKNGIATLISFRRRIKIFLDEGSQVLCHGALLEKNMPSRMREEMSQISQKIVDVLKLKNTPLLIQAILKEDGHFSVIEIASRISGGITSRYLPDATGVDLLEFSVSCQLGLVQRLDVREDEKTYGVKVLYGKEGKIGEIQGFKACKTEGLIEDYHLLKTSGDTLPSSISTKSRFAEIIVSGCSAEEIDHKLELIFKRLTLLDDNMQKLLIDEPEWQMLSLDH